VISRSRVQDKFWGEEKEHFRNAFRNPKMLKARFSLILETT
jgi:hypothetical protein